MVWPSVRIVIERCSGSQAARTRFTALEALRHATLLEVTLETGHPFTGRPECTWPPLRHPLLGDATYGRPSDLIGRPALHSWRIEFEHPVLGQPLRFEVPPPDDFEAALRRLSRMTLREAAGGRLGPQWGGQGPHVLGRVFELDSDLAYSVSYTTRPPRPGEVDGASITPSSAKMSSIA